MAAMAARLVLAAALLAVASPQSLRTSVVIGKTFLAGSTDPTAGSTAWALTSHGIAEKLFTVNKKGNIVGQVAESVAKIDDLTWEVTLKDGYLFSDGTAVTAQRVANALTELNTKNSGAQASLGMMGITAVDGLTMRIVSERATPVMDAVLAEWPFVVYLKKDGNRFFTGPFAVKTFVEDDSFELEPNEHYPRAELRPLVTVKKFPNGQLLASALEAGEVDLAFHLPVDGLSELRDQAGITIKSFEVGYHYMMWHNIRKPHLSDVRVRRALDIALDRSELAQELRGGRATRSLFPDYTPYFLDDSQQNADKSGAEALLDEAGWVKDADGHRAKDGVHLALDLVAYPQRPGLVIMQPLIEQRLAALGINVTSIVTSGENWDQLDQIMADKTYDLLMWAQNTLPAGDPQWFLNAFFRSGAGSNHAGLNSSAVNLLLDDLAHAEAHSSRVSATAAAHAEILSEVPVSNLVTPEWHVGLSSKLSEYEPWGSDYYVIRADLGPGAEPTAAPTPAPTPAPAAPTPAPAAPTPAPRPAPTKNNKEGSGDVEQSGAGRAMLGGLLVASLPLLLAPLP